MNFRNHISSAGKLLLTNFVSLTHIQDFFPKYLSLVGKTLELEDMGMRLIIVDIYLAPKHMGINDMSFLFLLLLCM